MVVFANIQSRNFCFLPSVCNIKIRMYKTLHVCGSVWVGNLVSDIKTLT
jgi:hypothetical protein